MRSPDASFAAALIAARDSGIVPRRFFWVDAKDRATGNTLGVGLWTGDDDVTVTLQDGQTGSMVSRIYYGMGPTLSISSIPLVSDLTVQTITVEMSQIADITQEIVRGYDVRLAKCDIHEGLLSTLSRELVSAPQLVFLGEVDGAPIETPAAGGEGSITLEVVSDAIRMLTRTNPRKRSHEAQKRRGGDEFGFHSNPVAAWKVSWGEANADGSSNTTPKKKSGGILGRK